MYKIHKADNSISKLQDVSFKDLQVTERRNLQEWIAKSPECLGEDLLIIQKEFNGFEETNERLDLLALDREGNLVVIENKLDDSGKDVTWQAIKYASYCSTLSYVQILDIYGRYLKKNGIVSTPEEKLEEFFESSDYESKINLVNSQRIIMVAGEFQKEITSSVIWLLSNGLNIKCFKAKPYLLDSQALVNFEQIIPLVETQDLTIKMADKQKEELVLQRDNQNRYEVRRIFWLKFLDEVNSVTQLFQGVSASKEGWIGKGAGKSGINYEAVVGKKGIKLQVYINTGNVNTNKDYYNKLLSKKDTIEKQFGQPMIWNELAGKVTAKISIEFNDGNVFVESDWPKLIGFVKENVVQFENAFKIPLRDLK